MKRLTYLLLVGPCLATSPAHADIYQWEYINSADPSQGKRQSTTLAPDGAGVDAMPGAELSNRDLTMAHLIGANLTEANFSAFFPGLATVLTDADLSQGNLRNSSFYGAMLTGAEFGGAEIRGASFGMYTFFETYGTGISLQQLYSTASYQARDLSGVGFDGNNLRNANFSRQNLSKANFNGAALNGADFTGAEIRGANFYTINQGSTVISYAQLTSTASYQARDLRGIDFTRHFFYGGNFAGQNLTNANFEGATLTMADFTAADARGANFYHTDAITVNLIWPDGHVHGLDLIDGDLLLVRDYDGAKNEPTRLVPLTVDQQAAMGPGGTLRMVFEADAWDSTISFAPGISVALGGTLELTFADDVNLATQVGRTFDLFDWTGVTPTGAFHVSSPYEWDLSNLYTTGKITLTAVPEPCNSASICLALAVLITTGRARLRHHDGKSRRRWTLVQHQTRLPMLTLIAVSLSVASSFAAPTIIDRDHFTNQFAPNSVPGAPVGNNVQISAVLNSLDPVGSTTISVKAIQGDSVVTLNYIGHHHSLFEGVHLYYAFVPFVPSLTGPWQIVASDSSGTAASVFTNAIPDPQFVPFVNNIVVQATSSNASVSWTLPSLDGFDVDASAVRIFDATSGGILFQSPVLPIQTTTYQPPTGVLQPGIQYVYNVILSDDEVFGHENASWGFSDPFRLTLPGDHNQDGVVDAADYVVWRKTDGGQAGYDNWRKDFGTTMGAGASQSANVPEPSAFLLLTIGLVGVACCYSVRRRSIPALKFTHAIVPLIAVAAGARADIYQWEYINPADPSQGKRQSTTLAPDGAGVDAAPGANLFNRNLTMAYLNGADLTGAGFLEANLSNADFGAGNLNGANFRKANLTNATFNAYFGCFDCGYALVGATLIDADFTDAEVRGANLGVTGFTLAQLVSTSSYRAHDLSGINLEGSYLAGGDFAGQNLATASFYGAWLTDADFTDADVRGANFAKKSNENFLGGFATGTGITPAQLYLTASYRAHDLSGIKLAWNNLAGGDFAGQDLTNADFYAATLTGADFTNAKVQGANFTPVFYRYVSIQTGITLAQLYSTASYQAHDLSGTGLGSTNLSGANFTGQNLTNADFYLATLTGAEFAGANVQGASFGAGQVGGCHDNFCFGVGSGITLTQLYSTASYQAHDLSGIDVRWNNLAGGNFAGQNITNSYFGGANLTGADFTGADARGAALGAVGAITTNLIWPDGHISGLDLDAGGLLIVRDYDGNPSYPYGDPLPAIPITVDQHFGIAPGGTLRMVFEEDAWDSTISFAPGIAVTLGGALELKFADDVNPASQVGRTLQIFDWTGVDPTGTFAVSSPYAWDLSSLYTTGEVTLTAIPEPSTFLLLMAAASVGCLPRRRMLLIRYSALFIACTGSLLASRTPALGQFNVIEATIPQMQAAMESGAITSEGLVDEYLRRIALYDDAGPSLNSVLALNPHALEIARSLDEERLATGPRGPLHGIPILLKDNIDTFDQPTTAGALILAGSIPPDDAFLTQKLRDAGAVILGKANLREFAGMVSRTLPDGFSALGGQTLNPYGPGVLAPGSSSTGSAVSVAANLVAAAVGTETQGSIVAPAAYNSVVGIRPTVGLISRDGIIPISHTQDTAGPLTRTVTDAAIMLGAMAGVDPNDPKTLASVGHTPANYTQFLNPNGLQGKRIGIVRDPLVITIDPTEVPLTEAAIDALEQGGATVVDHIDFSANLIALNNLWGTGLPKVLTHEFAAGIENYLASLGDDAPAHTLADLVAFNQAHASQAIPYGQSTMTAALATGGDLNDPGYIAQRDGGVHLIGTDGISALLDANNLDALMFPYEWPAIGATPGYPAVQVPAGFNVNGVPFSIGFVGKPFSEPELIEIAFAFEQATLLRRPPVLSIPEPTSLALLLPSLVALIVQHRRAHAVGVRGTSGAKLAM